MSESDQTTTETQIAGDLVPEDGSEKATKLNQLYQLMSLSITRVFNVHGPESAKRLGISAPEMNGIAMSLFQQMLVAVAAIQSGMDAARQEDLNQEILAAVQKHMKRAKLFLPQKKELVTGANHGLKRI